METKNKRKWKKPKLHRLVLSVQVTFWPAAWIVEYVGPIVQKYIQKKNQLLLHTSLMVKYQTRFGFQEAIISGTASIQFNSLLVQKLKSYYNIKC
jgi:hypothetical protein